MPRGNTPLAKKRNLSPKKAKVFLKNKINTLLYYKLEGKFGFYKNYPVSVCLYRVGMTNPCKGVVENTARFTWLFDF
ncbi:MAG: hypothetical protein DRH57_00050 [Candidatus Cloacimonadota bacterium]|nr:MAG: hypothetical protein DRH57_00050 [Candidatus Cloacimonadota bacterium]